MIFDCEVMVWWTASSPGNLGPSVSSLNFDAGRKSSRVKLDLVVLCIPTGGIRFNVKNKKVDSI